jgi:hypothetical protein
MLQGSRALVLIVRNAARNGSTGLVLTARVGWLWRWSLSRNFQTVLLRASVNKSKNRSGRALSSPVL